MLAIMPKHKGTDKLRADLRRPDVWLIGGDLIAWAPIAPLPRGADTLLHPGQVTQLPEVVQMDALLPLEQAVRLVVVDKGLPGRIPPQRALQPIGDVAQVADRDRPVPALATG